MKVFLHYEDNASPFLHKTLKIGLPKKWKTGPTSKLLNQFIETYNASDLAKSNTLDASNLHLALKVQPKEGSASGSTNKENSDQSNFEYVPLASDAITINVIDDRDAVYICHGASKTLAEIEQEKQIAIDLKKKELEGTVACVRFGCKRRFKKNVQPRPVCCYHVAPPVFHETAKFWSCCPDKKAYDWDQFQAIPGCQTGFCTDVKDDTTGDAKKFLGGCDLREAVNEATKLKSIDDFNASEAAGGSDAAPVMERLRRVMAEIGVENELFDQVVNGIKKDITSSETTAADGADGEGDEIAAATQDLGNKLKSAMKAIAAEQLRIK